MGSRVDEEYDISDSEINEYKEATYKLLKFRTYKIRGPNGKFRCHFCADIEEQDYTHLLQHAIQVAEGSAESAKQRANHFALATYLVTDLADEAERPPPPPPPSPAAESDDDSYDWTGFKEAMDSVQECHQKLVERLKEKEDELSNLEDLNQQLVSKERQSNKDLQEAREELIKGLKVMPSHSRVNIGVKRMGEVDAKAFKNACKARFTSRQAETKALELCSLWQEKVKNPEWHPFRVIDNDKGSTKEVLEDDESLRGLKDEWGEEAYDAVVTAMKEIHEYNPSGCYEVSELWNFEENRRATLAEVIKHIFKTHLRTLKRKRA